MVRVQRTTDSSSLTLSEMLVLLSLLIVSLSVSHSTAGGSFNYLGNVITVLCRFALHILDFC
jgi:hypothetical protein